MKSPLKLFLEERKLVVAGVLLLLLSSLATVLSPRILARIVDEGIVPRDYTSLMRLLYLFATIEVSKLAASALHTYLFSMAGQKLMHKLRNELYKNFLRLPASFFAKNSSAAILTRITNDINNVGMLFQTGVLQAVDNLVTVAFLVVAFFLLDYRFALIALAPFPILILVAVFGSRIMHRIFKALFAKIEGFNSFMSESINGISVIHLFNAERNECQRFEGLNLELQKAQRQTRLVFAVFHPLTTLAAGISITCLIYFGGKMIIAGQAPVGILVGSIAYVVWLSWPIIMVIDKWNIFISGNAAYRRVLETINWELEDGLGDISLPANRGGVIAGDIVFENVSFAYESGAKILDNFNLEIKHGENVGIVGPSGSGKSTVFNLLRRFYEPQSGRILINGRDIKTYDKRELRANLGLVQQDVFLFSGSIGDNLNFWDELSSQGGSGHFDMLSSNLELTKTINERGSNLSSGERQLISFLRCLASRPGIWLLDEASSNLDQRSEKRLFEILNENSEGKTVISIAHRVSTVREADRIIVLNKGRILEDGSHADLLGQNGLYSKLFQLQSIS